MTKSIYSILLIIVISLLTGCNDYYSNYMVPILSYHYLYSSNSDISFMSSNADSTVFNVESINTPWAFSKTPEWITLTPTKGAANSNNNIKVSVTEHQSAEKARTALFYLNSTDKDWSYNTGIAVSQPAAKSYLKIEVSELVFSGKSSTKEVSIHSNCSWTASSNQTWVTLTPVGDSVLRILPSDNPTNSYRDAYITISNSKGDKETLKITQSPTEISTSEKFLKCENIASKFSIEINSETDWIANTSAAWIEVSPEKGKAGKTILNIEVSPNTSFENRTGYITFKADNYKKLEIEISQTGLYIKTYDTLSFDARVSSKTLEIISNTDWEVISKPEWLTVSPASGNGNSNVTVSVQKNDSQLNRDGYLIFGQKGITTNCEVLINQKGENFNINNQILKFTASASQQALTIVSDGPWSSTTSDTWIATSPEAGEGDTVVNVSVEENTTGDERVGNISYKWFEKTTYVNIQQDAKYAKIENEAFTFDSKGGTHIIELSTDDKWNVEIETKVDWLSVSKESGTGDAEIILTASDNATVNLRSTTVLINSESAQSFRIIVIQQPRFLTVSQQSLLFFSKGGLSDPIRIKTNAAYEISTEGSWFTINEEEGNCFSVFVAPNLNGIARIGKITITLTDLVDCSYSIDIPIFQIEKGATFVLNGYSEDIDWNYISHNQMSIIINGFSSDKNWNDNFDMKFNINISDFSEDKNWNPVIENINNLE